MMSNFDCGVKRFIMAKATVTVAFPVDWKENAEIACKHCQFYIRSTQRCALNQEIVNYPEKYVGEHCQLEEIKE